MRIGIDLGGSKIAGVVLAPDGSQIERQRIPTPRGDYWDIVRTVVDMVHELERRIGQTATVGIGTPGAISPHSERIKNANTTELNGQPLLQDLQQHLGREVRMQNDANCFALSEATDGAGADATTVFGVIVGTGTGAGIVVNGQVLRGRNAIAGEWGHNPLPWSNADKRVGPNCYCGRRGCIETYLSGPGMAADYQRLSGEVVTAPTIVERAAAGDSLAEQTLQRYEQRHGARVGACDQYFGSGCDCFGGRHVKHYPSLRYRANAVGGLCIFR